MARLQGCKMGGIADRVSVLDATNVDSQTVRWSDGIDGQAMFTDTVDPHFIGLSAYLYLPVPCLRRATAVNYTDADEDAEKLLSFLDEVRSIMCTCSIQTIVWLTYRLKKLRAQMGRAIG